MNLSLSNRSIFVTGPANGMGAAISIALAEAGADLILAGRDAAAMEHVALAVGQLGRQASIQECDVVSDASVENAVRYGREAMAGRLDGLVCIAGTTGAAGKTLWENTAEDYRAVFDVNVLGTLLPMRHVLPHLVRQKRGSVVNIGGTFGFKGAPFQSLYAATKWAVRGISRSAALEAGPHGVRINTVCPGGVEGSRLERQLGERARRDGLSYEEAYSQFTAGAALRRMSTAEDVAQAVLFLLSDAARNITGQDLLVDGGTVV